MTILFYSLNIFFFGLFVNIFILSISHFRFLNILYDKNYLKPQAFHSRPIICFGGISIYLLFFITSIFFRKSEIFFNFLFIITPIFIIGLLDDLKFKLLPSTRLFFIVFTLLITIYSININIINLDFYFLEKFLNKFYFLKLLFICLCFIFLINGANFIDGFNGLLSIHAIVLISIFNVINYCFNNYELLLIGAIFFSAILSFLFFNFPKARMFLGDSGSYLIGTIIAYLAIETSNQTSNISPFFFAILLFYPFFEVFFSFFRKILISQSSPLKPDKYHLHMILFKNINQNIKNKNKSNVLTSLIINVIFLLLIIPSIFIFEVSIFCKLYFLVLIICYLLFYIFLNKDKNRFKK
jgi:UDP-N-acetylmuramyl pentapeptide phosphotransferase/UDP-N-acetylglucosamine-1-phosphate transferase